MGQQGHGVRWLRWALGMAGVLLALAVLVWLAWPHAHAPQQGSGSPPPATPGITATFVGTPVCAACHQAQHRAWQGSHHELAMQAASAVSVLAPFKGERFTEAGVTAVFSQRQGKFYVRTEGADARMQEFEITHTLGFTPLQQYLIPMPNHGMQALTIAWDTRPRTQGGQRWFHLQKGQRVRPGDALHWTGRQNNWNFMCAECHTTQFKKNFDAAKGSYGSTWSEMNVACEACHGPGSQHQAWSAKTAAQRQSDSAKGLSLALDERHGVHWTQHTATGNAIRSRAPSTPRAEVEMCARCHGHRSQISDNYAHGKPQLDTHVPSLVEKGLFWPDGQMRGEVYNDASFQQSKMFQKGVTCSDCHDPHTLKLRAPGNQTCLQCHASTQYAAKTHHFHAPDSKGAACAACHMPTTTYMVVDPRHDHSIRVPRPDLSVHNGTPNACNQCHADKTTSWAAKWTAQWYPALQQRQRPLDTALLAHDQGDANASTLLGTLANDASQASIIRATALERLAPSLQAKGLRQLAPLLNDKDPLVRKTAVEAFADWPPNIRAQQLRPLLTDPVKAVRTTAARWLVGLPTQTWMAQDQAALRDAINEYIAVQQFNADRPEAFNNLGTLHADQGDWPKAEAALLHAIAMDPQLAVSRLNLADIYRAQGREEEAQALIRQVLQQHPRDATAHHALGLSLLRQHRPAQALEALRRAAQLEPGNARFAYVYALAVKQQKPSP